MHSFADLGITSYLLIFMIFFLFLSLGLYLIRLSHVPQVKTSEDVLTGEFALFIGIVILALWAILILLGTSPPLISMIFGPPSNVSVSYYVRTQLPSAILGFLVLASAPFLRWRGSELSEFMKNIRLSLLIAIVLTALAFIFNVRSPVYLICIFTALLAVVSNLLVLAQRGKGE